jgi:hypothetical protein
MEYQADIMRKIQNLATPVFKQRLRAELSNHIENFLLQGGKIEVINGLGERGTNTQPGRWPAAAGLFGLPVSDID